MTCEKIDLKYGATYAIEGGWRVSLADMRTMKFDEGLQKEFDEWYNKQTAKGLIDVSYTVPTLSKESFDEAVRSLISAEKAIEEGRVGQPPKPAEFEKHVIPDDFEWSNLPADDK